MFPINPTYKPGNTGSTLQPLSIESSTGPVAATSPILNALCAVLDYIYKHIFPDTNAQDQQATRAWATSCYIEYLPNHAEGPTVRCHIAPRLQITLEFYGIDVITIRAGCTEYEYGASWTIKQNGNKAALVYKNDFSWVDPDL